MAGGLTLIPSYTTDNIFPAYQDRLLIKSLGVQQGVVEIEDYKISAGSGLQVNVKAGKAFVEQTKAIEESSNVFYNGLYNVLNPTEQNPYNSVEVSAVNPQIAQIILRVYDITELGIGGSSYGRVEWLNGTPNAGATKAHVEAGEALSFGAAALPTSSLRIAYVVVPKNATISSEYSIVDARTFANKSLELNRGQKYVFKSYTKAEAEAGVEPSKTRTAAVNMRCETSGSSAVIVVNGESAGDAPASGGGTATIYVPPGQKWTTGQAMQTYTILL